MEESEQALIESYLKTHEIEECLDEVINSIVTSRPPNPFMAIANAFQSKSFPEILDVRLNSILHQGSYGVKASVYTNIGKFSAFVNDDTSDQLEMSGPKDFSVIDRKLKELLLSVDPTNIHQFDEAINTLSELTDSESMALSIACCRAASKYKGMELFEYFAKLFATKSDNLVIPLPVGSLSLACPPQSSFEQIVHVFPVRSSSLELAVEKLNTLFHRMRVHQGSPQSMQLSRIGTLSLSVNSIEELLKQLNTIFHELEETNNLKLSVFYSGDEAFRPSEGSYAVSNTLRSGQDMVDQIINLWTEMEFIAIDQAIAFADTNSSKALKKKIQETIFTVKTTNGDKLKYCAKGIGGDNGCSLQVPLDSSQLPRNMPAQDLEKLLGETPYNIAKFHIRYFRNVSHMIDIHQKVSKKLPVYVDTTSYKNHSGTFDDFETDLAVGMGAVQFHGNGIYCSDFTVKLNRLLSIQIDNEKLPFVGSKFRVGFT